MKIVIVIDSWQDGNGAIVSTKRMVKELENRGYEITVVTTGEYGEGFYTVPGFYLPGVRESMENMGFLFGKGKKKILRKAYEGADIVQIQFPFFMARNAVKVAKKMGIPVFGSTHIQPQNVVNAAGIDSPILENLLYWLFNHDLFKQVDLLQSPSQFAVDLFTKHGSRAEFKVISNGIPSEYKPVQTERPDSFKDYFVIMNVGRHALEKRQELLIDAVLRSKYKDRIKLLLCGRGEDSKKLRQRAAELPVEPLVEWVTAEDKLTYLNTADLYLHASIIELESLSCLEAIGCGLPCLISDAEYSAASQFAYDERFLFTKDDVNELASKIDYWYEHKDELRNLKPNILEMAEKYRFKNCIDEMEALYKEIIDRKNKDSRLVEAK